MLGSMFSFLHSVLDWILPFVGTVVLGYSAWTIWVHYVQQDFISGITYSILEIIPPREVERSPRAMELFFTNALYHWSQKGGLEQYWQGAVWFWFSLEIVSKEGQVHFYVRSPSRIKALIETQMYSQYPQCQVKEVEDYTLAIDEISKTSEYNLWGCEFKLQKHEVFPIKTYVDFGLDKDPKEEYKVDPIAPVVELAASFKKGEQMWIQIVITPPTNRFYHTKGTMFKKHDWVAEGDAEIARKLLPFTGQRVYVTDKSKYSIEMRAPSFLDELMKSATKKMNKVAFVTGIRIAYVATKDIFPIGVRSENSRNVRLLWRQYENPYSNGFFRKNSTQADAYGGIFMSSKETVIRLANRHLHAYREREFFYLPLRHHLLTHGHALPWPISPGLFPGFFHHFTFMLNVEELATLWHFPGLTLKVPTLERIESKEASPPQNLPI